MSFDVNQRRAIEESYRFTLQARPAIGKLAMDSARQRMDFDLLLGFLARLFLPDATGVDVIQAFVAYRAEWEWCTWFGAMVQGYWAEAEKSRAWRERVMSGSNVEPESPAVDTHKAATMAAAIDRMVVLH